MQASQQAYPSCHSGRPDSPSFTFHGGNSHDRLQARLLKNDPQRGFQLVDVASDQLWVILSGMLGIAGLHSFNKLKGTDTAQMGVLKGPTK